MTDDLDDELTAGERDQLARWQPEGPPAGFADRVLAAHVAPVPARAPVRLRYAVGAVALAGAAAITFIATRPTPRALAVEAAPVRAIERRETVDVGGRAVAVAEAGARLGYLVSGRTAHIEQPEGGVFYRVEPGGRFDVVTPAGTVEVTGTCFRVEVHPMNKPAILSGALGAVVATAAVVTVYEGKIRVVSGATPVEVKAGQRATLTAGGPVAVADTPADPAAAGGDAPVVIARVEDDPAVATLSREQLIARDRAQREQLAALTARVQMLESAKPGPGGLRGPGLDGDWLNPSQEELAQWAKECTVKIDFPPFNATEPMKLDGEVVHDLHLSDAEVAAANAALVASQAAWTARVRGWYVEATGDTTGGDSMSARAMAEELQDKAAPGEPRALQKRLAEERAGLLAPPADLSKASPFERYFRAFSELGNVAERDLAGAIGADKAHAVRAHGGGWPARMSMSGCNAGGDDE